MIGLAGLTREVRAFGEGDWEGQEGATEGVSEVVDYPELRGMHNPAVGDFVM